MGDDNLIALFDQIHDGLCGASDQLQLLYSSVAQSVTAQGDDDFLCFFHDDPPFLPAN